MTEKLDDKFNAEKKEDKETKMMGTKKQRWWGRVYLNNQEEGDIQNGMEN